MITVAKCREKLGKKAEKMTDDEIIRLRNHLYAMVSKIIDEVISDEDVLYKGSPILDK